MKDYTGWATADVPMNWTGDDDRSDNEWMSCPPPQDESGGFEIDSDKVQQAREEAEEVAALCGF